MFYGNTSMQKAKNKFFDEIQACKSEKANVLTIYRLVKVKKRMLISRFSCIKELL